MLVESLSFKYILELFNFFKINKLDLTYAKISFLNVDKIYSNIFSDYDSLISFYQNNYVIYDKNQLGRYAFLTNFNLESNLYNIKLTYDIREACNENFKMNIGYPHDEKRLKLIETNLNKQKFLIEKNLATYCTYSSKFKKIYTEEIYSPSYAEPGWSLGTSNIKKYGDLAKLLDYKIYKN